MAYSKDYSDEIELAIKIDKEQTMNWRMTKVKYLMRIIRTNKKQFPGMGSLPYGTASKAIGQWFIAHKWSKIGQQVSYGGGGLVWSDIIATV